MAVESLTKDSFRETIRGTENLAVVEFYAPWCRTCRTTTPRYEQLAKLLAAEGRKADFYKVDFKANQALCFTERVFALPTFHFYVPEIGRVNRFTSGPSTLKKRLTRELDRFLEPPEDGGISTLDRLQARPLPIRSAARRPPPAARPDHRATCRPQALRSRVVEPVLRYNDLVGLLHGLADLKDGEPLSEKSAGLIRALETDQERRERLGALFELLDRDGSGQIDFTELAAAVDILRAAAAPGAADPSQLLERIAADAGGSEAVAIDRPTFERIMTQRTVAQFATPEDEFLAAFEGLDRDGDGSISKDELLTTVGRFYTAMGGGDAAEGVEGLEALLGEAFDAFDTDQSGDMSYEEFVMMVCSPPTPQSAARKLAGASGARLGRPKVEEGPLIVLMPRHAPQVSAKRGRWAAEAAPESADADEEW